MTIKHIVIGGGGPIGFAEFGALRELNKNNFWHLKNIETIYGTSIGAFIGLIISLDYEWDWIDDYFIKRPWEPILESAYGLFTSFNQKGIFDRETIKIYLEPLLTAKNFTVDMTLKNLYDLTKKEIHMFSIDLNSSDLDCIDISYKTHPDLDILTALNMTMAVPILFKPVLYNNGCYIDGGVINNLPFKNCLERNDCNLDEILTIINFNKINNITSETEILDYTIILINKLINKLNNKFDNKSKNTITIPLNEYVSLDKWYYAISSEDTREKIINIGADAAKDFLKSLI